MADKLAYLASPGTIDTLFKKIKEASVPDRFDREYIESKLNIKGGTGRACIPFLKRLGFLKTDGTPSDSYKNFRNSSLSGAIIAAAMKNIYLELFQVNENIHKLSDSELKAIVVQVSGLSPDTRTVELIVSTFKYLKKHAKFDGQLEVQESAVEEMADTNNEQTDNTPSPINLSYTIYLNLPNTTDIAVFNAIFKALKENMLVR